MDRREWSGVTFFRVLKGGLEDPQNLLIEMIDFFLMDLGSAAFTSFKYTPEITDYQMANEHLIEEGIRTGCLHSHHFMETFFSGEDVDDLVINTKDESVDFYLSTIVNVKGEWIARLAYRMKETIESQITSSFWSKIIKGKNSSKKTVKTERSALYMIPLTVVQEHYEDVRPRIEALKPVVMRSLPSSENGHNYDFRSSEAYNKKFEQGKLFESDENRMKRESQEEEHDVLLGALMMGTIAFKEGLDRAVVEFRKKCTDSLGNAYNQMVDMWADQIVNKAETVISIAEGQQMSSSYVDYCLGDLIQAIDMEYAQTDDDAESMLATKIEELMELKASMVPEGITLNENPNGKRHF